MLLKKHRKGHSSVNLAASATSAPLRNARSVLLCVLRVLSCQQEETDGKVAVRILQDVLPSIRATAWRKTTFVPIRSVLRLVREVAARRDVSTVHICRFVVARAARYALPSVTVCCRSRTTRYARI